MIMSLVIDRKAGPHMLRITTGGGRRAASRMNALYVAKAGENAVARMRNGSQ